MEFIVSRNALLRALQHVRCAITKQEIQVFKNFVFSFESEMMVNNTVHVSFAHSGVAFCDVCLTPEEAADLSLNILIKLSDYYKQKKKCRSK